MRKARAAARLPSRRAEYAIANVPPERAPGAEFDIRVHQGGSGRDLLFVHGAGGLLENDPFIARLSQHFRVTAPMLPGYEDSQGGEHLREMLDFTLHVFDVWDSLQLNDPIVVGHSMGGMIAAEMASIAPHAIRDLVLLCPAGLWRDDHPVADIFAALPFELPGLLFHDPQKSGALLAAGGDLNDPEFLTEFLVGTRAVWAWRGKFCFRCRTAGCANAFTGSKPGPRLCGARPTALFPRYMGRISRI